MRFSGKIPVTLVGGFLGAGKTTLVNNLVSSGERRYGVIVNEFGDAGVDAALIEDLEEVVEIGGGCLCCVGREDLISTLYVLLARRDPPDHIIVELSGLADPVPAAQVVVSSELSGMLRLDGIVAVVDSRNLEATLREFPEGRAQLAYASVVLLNKADLVDEEILAGGEQLVRRLNPLANVLRTSRSVVDKDTVLDLRAFSPEWRPVERPARHAEGVSALTLESESPLRFAEWSRFRDRMLLSRSGLVYRAKGLLCFEEMDRAVVFQSVRELFSTAEHTGLQDGLSRLVVIGRDLNERAYREAFGRVAASARARPGERR